MPMLALPGTNHLKTCVRLLAMEDIRAEFDLAFRRFSQWIGKRTFG